MADFNARLTTFEAGINSKIDSQVSSYLDRNGIWNGKKQTYNSLLWTFSDVASATRVTSAQYPGYIWPTDSEYSRYKNAYGVYVADKNNSLNSLRGTSWTSNISKEFNNYFSFKCVDEINKSGLLSVKVRIMTHEIPFKVDVDPLSTLNAYGAYTWFETLDFWQHDPGAAFGTGERVMSTTATVAVRSINVPDVVSCGPPIIGTYYFFVTRGKALTFSLSALCKAGNSAIKLTIMSDAFTGRYYNEVLNYIEGFTVY